MKTRIIKLFFCLLITLGVNAYAFSKIWTGTGGDGNWYTVENWSPTGVPNSSDDVTIDANVGITIAASSPSITFNSLTLGGTNSPTLVLSTTIITAGSITIKNKSTLEQSTTYPLLIGGNLTVEAGGNITHSANPATKTYLVNLNINGDFNLQSGSSITLTAKGYETGPGSGINNSAPGWGGGGGGGHGGAGGAGELWSGGPAYDSLTNPTDLGSGGGVNSAVRGGGAVIISVLGTLTVNGNIIVNGDTGRWHEGVWYGSGGGAGGTINITAGSITGSGIMQAKGGDARVGTTYYGGGGGGGRIALASLNDSGFAVTLSTAGNSGSQNGYNGTIYVKKPGNGKLDLSTAPINTSLNSVSSHSITLTWNANSNSVLTSYEISYSSTNFTSAISTASLTRLTAKNIPGLLPATTYYLRVRAYNGDNIPTTFDSIVSTMTLPASPSGLTGSVLGVSSIAWNWNPVDSATGYKVYDSVALIGNPVSTVFNQIGLNPNAPYYVKVSALAASSEGPFSTSSVLYTLAKTPTNTSVVSLSSHSVFLEWGANNNPGTTNYEISYSSTNFVSAISTENLTTAVNKSIGSLLAGTTYYFRVRAYNSDGFATAFDSTVTTMTLPSPPSGLAGTVLGVSSIAWNWNAVDSATGYRVYYQNSMLASPTATTLNQTVLSANAPYAIRVSAINLSGEGPLSDSATFYTFAKAPVNTSIIAASSYKVSLNWDASNNPGITNYEVSYSSTNFASSISTTSLMVVVSTSIANLIPGTTYYFRVRAFNGNDVATTFDVIVSTALPGIAPIWSATHPDSINSYANGSAEFSLTDHNNPYGIAGYYYIVDNLINTIPTALTGIYFSGSSVTVASPASDGTWYFHAVEKDGNGNIATTAAHYKFLVKNSVDPLASNTFKTPDGIKVDIPAGAIASAAQIIISTPTIKPLPPSGSELNPTSVVRELKFSDGTQNFQSNVTITLPYSDSDIAGLDEQKLRLFYYNEAGGYWALVPNSTVDASANKVIGQVNHFTLFGILAYSPAQSALETVSNYPNPFAPLKGEKTRIRYNLDTDRETKIKIYDAFGLSVWDQTYPSGIIGGGAGPNEVQWDGKTNNGRSVGMGGYICVIEAGGKKKTLKIGVK